MRGQWGFCSLELGSGEATLAPEGRDGWMKKGFLRGTEQLFPRQVWGGKVRIWEWEKGVCEQIEPLLPSCERAFLCSHI